MRHVMVLNAKGGCGKSTLSTNIAVFFARDGHNVCLADYDPQRSSLDWLAMRPADLPAISAVAAFDEGLRNVPRNSDVLVIDALRLKPHPAHFSVDQALAVIERLKPKKGLLTHMGHDLDHETTNRRLPAGVELAYDGLVLEIA